MDPHSLYADPDPEVFLNADPDPGGKIYAVQIRILIQIQLNKFSKKKIHEEFSIVVKYIKDYSKVRNKGALCQYTLKIE